MADNPFIYPVTADTFAVQVLDASQQVPVLVDFWADWCAPCRILLPVLDKLAAEYGGRLRVAKVNADEQTALTQQFGIRSLPTVLIFRHGAMVDQFMGAQHESTIRQIVERYLETPADRRRAEALQALQADDAARAVTLLREAVALAPTQYALHVDLGNALLAAGETAAAGQVLAALPLAERTRPAAKTLEARLQLASALTDAPPLAELTAQVAAAPDNLSARHQLGVRRLLAGDAVGALEQFMEIMRRDRQFGDELGRRSLLAAFALIDDPELVKRYRKQMASLLF